ncbi:uncharacterized protein LOC130647993 [Hydractinia symbiolongicarpus]|uniref:uncharacterized protein LOC130647993 n=1 Tax=Hydractinia symbiolongicarpus TaxID=13093 RepID=UPI0025506F86|nr:uncharacterized protein LOC130647993 [Hydractinia symbiolongicarpus]
MHPCRLRLKEEKLEAHVEVEIDHEDKQETGKEILENEELSSEASITNSDVNNDTGMDTSFENNNLLKTNVKAKNIMPNIKDKVKYTTEVGWRRGTVHSRAGKASGKYRNWLNIVDKVGNVENLDRTKVEKWDFAEKVSQEALICLNKANENDIKSAKEKETGKEILENEELSSEASITNSDVNNDTGMDTSFENNNLLKTNVKAKNIMPNIKDKVKYTTEVGWRRGTVHSRAGKASGKYRNWLNIVDKVGNVENLDRTKVEKWDFAEKVSQEALICLNKANENDIKSAKEKETGKEILENEELSSEASITNSDVNNDTGMDTSFENNNLLKTNVKAKNIMPNIKDKVKYTTEVGWRRGTVHSRAGKASEKYRNWLNIVDKVGNVENLDRTKVEKWDFAEKVSQEALICLNKANENDIKSAKEKELNNWIENKVFDKVKIKKQSCISTRWILTEKNVHGQRIVKARLVAQGFEDFKKPIQTDSPTCTKESLRLMLSILACKEWDCNSIDIKAAFLQEKPIEKDIYLKPPKEFQKDGYVWKLNNTVYGLADASRTWYSRVKLGVAVSKFDAGLFYYRKDGRLHGIMTTHVDDFCWGGTKRFLNNKITVLPIDKHKDKDELLNTKQKHDLRVLIGQLN